MSNPHEESVEQALSMVRAAVISGRLTPEAARNLSRWLSEPHYAEYRERLLDLIQRQDFAELNRLFWERIPFGTGGRRGSMSDFGSATINDRTIAESAHGLAVYVKRWCEKNGLLRQGFPPRAAVAFDSRHRSQEFAQRTACVLAAHGFQVFFFPEPRATPELSFAVIAESCHTGVVISASHNPPSDNGFKAYWSTGGQILPPHDAGIIECVDAATEIPSIDFDTAVSDGRIKLLGEIMDSSYVRAVCLQSLSSARDISALYTPLHGVGESSVYRVVQQLGFAGVSIFEPQRTLDGSFPNVPDHLPNPERPEVFGPAIAHAKQTGAELVFASDPDADRMAVAVRDRSGEFVCLTGNQLSALLTDYVLCRRAANGSLSPDHFIIKTLVTTPLVAAIGRRYGVKVVRDVLVGFKHIAREIDVHGPDRFVFATEESIGFMAGNYCRDKDAAVGAIFVLELAAELKQRGQTLLDHLDELYSRHGVYVEQTVSIMSPGPTGQARLARIMQTLRDAPVGWCGPAVWEVVRDYQRHEARSLPSNRKFVDLPEPSGNLLILDGQASDCLLSLAIRPSGTEPKIKFYGFVRTDAWPDLATAKRRATECASAVMSAMQHWIGCIE
ncbi:MAG: phospho-sugar mutase [Planctomycetota bacterium]